MKEDMQFLPVIAYYMYRCLFMAGGLCIFATGDYFFHLTHQLDMYMYVDLILATRRLCALI